MADAGICPKCGSHVTELNVTPVPLRNKEKKWYGVAYNCPMCDAILGAGFDPFGLVEDTANRVAAKLKEQ